MPKENCPSIDECRKEYKKLKFKLPNFEMLLEDFDIEKAFEKKGGFLIRAIRRVMMEKLTAVFQLFESLMNPVSPPVFFYEMIKNISENDRTSIREIYKKLAKIHMTAMKMDLVYDEKKEEEFINFIFKDWQKLKIEICTLMNNLEKNPNEPKKSRTSNYFN